MNKLLFAALLSCLTACSPQEHAVKEPHNGITYTRDNKTSLCFAKYKSITYGGSIVTSITNVPCTDEVKNNF